MPPMLTLCSRSAHDKSVLLDGRSRISMGSMPTERSNHVRKVHMGGARWTRTGEDQSASIPESITSELGENILLRAEFPRFVKRDIRRAYRWKLNRFLRQSPISTMPWRTDPFLVG